MKKIFIKALCLICAVLMLCPLLFACKTSTENDTEAPSNVHVVKFNVNGGTPIENVEVRHGQKIAEPKAPTRDNYIFLHWEQNNRIWIFGSKEVTEDITLSAVWISAAELFNIEPAENGDDLIITGFAQQKDVYVLRIPEKINGKNVVAINANAFERIHEQHADHIIIPKTVKVLGEKSFSNITKVHLEFEGSISTLDVSTFEGCATLEVLKLDPGMKTIPYRCFFEATGLVTIDIPEGVETIEENAFTSCTGLQTVVLPSTLKTVEDSAFDKADNLVVIFFKGTEEEFDALEISNNNAPLISSKVYFYSETEPSEKGGFWHYDKGNTPVLW